MQTVTKPGFGIGTGRDWRVRGCMCGVKTAAL